MKNNNDNKVLEILKEFKEALDNKDFLVMADCISAMKETDPAYVSLMFNAMNDEDEEDDDCEYELVHDPNDYEYTPEEAEMLGLKWDPILKMYI